MKKFTFVIITIFTLIVINFATYETERTTFHNVSEIQASSLDGDISIHIDGSDERIHVNKTKVDAGVWSLMNKDGVLINKKVQGLRIEREVNAFGFVDYEAYVQMKSE